MVHFAYFVGLAGISADCAQLAKFIAKRCH